MFLISSPSSVVEPSSQLRLHIDVLACLDPLDRKNSFVVCSPTRIHRAMKLHVIDRLFYHEEFLLGCGTCPTIQLHDGYLCWSRCKAISPRLVLCRFS